MADQSSDDKTEAPTEKRRQEARNKGNVAKSTEVNSAFVLLAGLLLLKFFGPWMFERMVGQMQGTLGLISHPQADYAFASAVFIKAIVVLCIVCAPVCLGIFVIGVVANIMQVGFMLTAQPLIPSLEKISPLAGAKRLFTLRSFVELAKNVLKLAIIGFVAYVTVKGQFNKFLGLGDTSAAVILVFLLNLSFTVILRIALVLILLALFDYAYQRYETERGLKMTKQEIKEEAKQSEGDPQIKARVRSLQREMARRRMMQEVPKATVVVTNPTHLAIAIRYEPSEMDTPRIIAKGKRLVAEQIKSIAIGAGIPIVEDKPLARAMYDEVHVGDDIPLQFFSAVAEILAYVYRLKKKAVAA